MPRRQQQADRALRPAMRSPGRPMPARHVERELWRLIAQGRSSEQAAIGVGVPTPVGRWLGPAFPDARGGWWDRNDVSRDLRTVRAGTEFEWFVSHTARRSVATLLDDEGLTARSIADQLGHARVPMTQDVSMADDCPVPTLLEVSTHCSTT
jgi:integrase